MKKSTFIIALSSALVSGCAGSRQSQQLSSAGYSEIRSTQNQFVIDFTGSGMTSVDKVEEYALVRASETTLAHGYNFFRVERRQDLTKRKAVKSISEKDKEEFSLFQSEKTRKGIEEVSPSIRLYIKCYKEDPRLFDVFEAAKYLKIHKKG